MRPRCQSLCPPPSFGPIALLRPLKMFPQGAVVCYVRTKEPVLAVVQGPSPHGEQYRTITYKHGATEVEHDRAAVKRLTAVLATSPPPRPTETPVQPAEELPPKGVRQLQSTLHAFFQPRVLLPWHHQHLCMSLCLPKPHATYSMTLVGHEFCRVCAGKWLVGSGVHPPGGWGDRHLVTVPPGLGGVHRRP